MTKAVVEIKVSQNRICEKKITLNDTMTEKKSHLITI